ncbi:hypothetical protein GCM10017566_56660 [Amycolatopsis bartoniae]|uniref:Uncharacterized protein n=1 Tax=Amycolatopsis bartoniae TaxID=941986 RepID=A0A8H9J4X8_9PSEU|nr:hypothetical protein GCM10017566_56660 [Amycolatopsis bartoniae]
MVDAAGGERRAERFGDVLLPDDLGEGRRTVLPVESESHGARLPFPGDLPSVDQSGQKGDPRTRQSLLILAAFRPWGGSQDGRRGGPPHSVVENYVRGFVRS